MSQNLSSADRWLMRIKDLLLIGGSLCAAFLFLVKYYALPGEVLAHANDIKETQAEVIKIQKTLQSIDDRFELVDVKQDYTNKNMDEVKQMVKLISEKVR